MASASISNLVAPQEAPGFDQSLLWELALFAITVVLTVALRSNKAKSKKQKSLSKSKEPTIPHCCTPGITHAGDANCLPRVRQMAISIRTIMSHMEDQPTLRTLNKSLETYKKLREKSQQQYMKEALTHSGHSVDQFYNVMLQISSRLGQMDMFDAIMDDMYQSDMQGSLDFYENAMKLLASQKQYQLALNVYDRLVAADLEPSAVTYSCLVGFATEVGNFDLAVSFFEKLSSIATPSIRAYMTVLRVHGKRQDWEAASAIFQDMRTRGATIDGPVLNLVLAVGVAVDKIEAVEAMLAEAETMTPPVPDTVSYNTLVKGYAQRNDGNGAFRTLCRMTERGLSCTSITFNTALDASFRGAMPGVALKILKNMKESGFRPDKYTGTILIKGLSKNATHELIEACQAICRDPKCHMDASLRSKIVKCAAEATAKLHASPQRESTPPWRRAI